MSKRPDYLNLPFSEAVKYFKDKVNIPTEKWEDFQNQQHDFAFTIAGLTRADLLEDARYLVNRGVEKGTSFEEFQNQFRRLIVRKGWNPKPLPAGPEDYRLRIIFETNIRRSYSAGRYQQLNDPDILRSRPYRIWKHGDSPNPRDNHLALDGKVFPANSPFWEIASPSCAFGCKCRVFSLSERDLFRLGKEVEEPPDPNSIAEDGFRGAAGSTPKSERQRILARAKKRLSPKLRQKVR
jgi:uncharacterized protein with gpF-like domain